MDLSLDPEDTYTGVYDCPKWCGWSSTHVYSMNIGAARMQWQYLLASVPPILVKQKILGSQRGYEQKTNKT